LAKDGFDSPKPTDAELKKLIEISRVMTGLDSYFLAPFSYYLQLLQPLYVQVYDLFEEIENISSYDDFRMARTSLFHAAQDYDLTVLGEELLLESADEQSVCL